MGPKTTPERVKIEDDFQELKKGSSRRSWSRLGPILGRLETRLGVKIVLPCSVALVLLKIRLLDKIWLQDASWAELGRFGGQNAEKRGAKPDPRELQK